MKTDGTIYAWMQNVMAPRILESNSFDVSNGGVISFDYRAASDDNGGNGCEANDDKEGVYVQYSTNNGTTWVTMKLMFPSVESQAPAAANIGAGTYVYNWNKTTIPIPVAAQTSNTKFRWYQHQSTTGSQDSWGIDDVKIIKNNTATSTITDLSTNTVIASTTTSSENTTVSPASTRTYRANITDGTTSCFDDIIITIAGGTPTTISYSSSTFLNNISTAQNITITNGPVSGAFTATPSGLSINSTTEAITPSTSTIGIYTVSVPTTCGTTSTTVEILSTSCTTCSNPSCPVSSIIATTAAQGQTNITTTLNTAGDQFGNAPLVPCQSITICVPVTVVAGSTILGFKQLSSSSPGGCTILAEEIITYQLNSATNCSGAAIAPTVTNASSVASGFNPEWNGLTSGNYVLCFTLNVVNTAICSTVDLQGIGYYNVVPACTNPSITTQPLNTQNVCKNAIPSSLGTTATGTSITYQWYSNAANSNTGGTLISGAISSIYTPTTNTVGTFYYYAIVSSGACTTLSNTVSVNIFNKVINTLTGCMAQDSALVSDVFPATSISASVSNAFTENATISVVVISPGSGHLLFQLDNGVYQDSPFFENVNPGIHTVSVIDSEGCTSISINVLVINYPHYFTPNGDGINDTWNIVGLQSENNASIYIFDRYGKLIKQISPFGLGWDGTYNGNIMPSTDYWFKVEYKENNQVKEFKSHFSLKR